MDIKYWFFLLILLACFLSCNNIQGTYVANYDVGTDTIKVFSDHRYVQICHPPNDMKQYSDSGTWEMSDGRINFRDWIDRNGMLHGYGEGHSIFGTDVKRNYFTGSIKLPIDYDMNYYYIKK